ncbi:MAG: ABC transporter permease [Deltaproteobacteria bacterium]|nr:ABC transporter permease [Deltaproteobacteria bacterium]
MTSSLGIPRFIIITVPALGVVSLLLLSLGISPLTIAITLARGSVLSWLKFNHVLSVWIPLLLCSCGLLFTFRAGLWNIGIEGQVVCGAIGATLVLRLGNTYLPAAMLLSLSFLSAFLAGGVWGALAGFLKNRGGVNEIFGGLGLNFVAQGAILWFILGPWKREGMASMSGTDLFARELWMWVPRGWRTAPAALILTVTVFLFTAFILSATRFGLKIKAVGLNPKASRLFGINPDLTGFTAMIIGGGLAGLAGAVQVSCVYHRLIPSISSGYGYLALLIVMLANYKVTLTPIICLLFACLTAGSIQLPITLQIDSSLSGVIQGTLVLSGLLAHGLQQRRLLRKGS